MSNAAEQLGTPQTTTPERNKGPESSGDRWRIYPNAEGGYELCVWVDRGIRKKIRIPKKYVTPDERARFAKGAAAEMVREYKAAQKSSPATEPKTDPSRITFGEIADLWVSGDLAKKYPDHVVVKKSVGMDRLRFKTLKKSVGDVPIEAFTTADAERAMRSLGPRCKTPGARRQYAQLISKTLSLAAWPLQIIKHSPLPRGFLPKNGPSKAKVFLYPKEDAKLLACAAVPIVFRVLYGFLAREGMRVSEAIGLRWAHVDLTLGTVRLDTNKTNSARSWKLDPGVARALDQWRKRLDPAPKPADYVFLDASGGMLVDVQFARLFREEHLPAAGIDRPELFERGPNRIPIRAHDLRATMITLSLANGETEAWVRARTGHTSSMMLARYDRTARFASELGLGRLAPLDQAIPELGVPGTVPPPSDPTTGVGDGSPPLVSGESSRALAQASQDEAPERPFFDSSYEGSNPSVGTEAHDPVDTP